MTTRSLIHTASAILASAILAFSFAAAPARAATITINGSNCTWDNGQQALTCSSNGGGASVPSGCTLIPSQSTVSAGATVSLSASCSGGGAPTSYAWSGGGLPATGGASVSTTVTATTTYSVTPSNNAGSGNTASAQVTVGSAPPPPPPPGGGLANCSAQGLSVVSGSAIPTSWGTGGVWYSSQAGAFGDNAVWVFTVTVPAGTPPSSTNGFFTLSEFGSQPTPRQLTISTQACDFRGWDYLGGTGPLGSCNNGTTCRVLYSVHTPSFADIFSGVAGLTAGTTYYISARNFSSSGSSCGASNCGAVMNASPAQ